MHPSRSNQENPGATPLFSILVPVYNAEDFLHECLQSLRAQSIADVEVILVNDGSTDTSGAICDAFAKDSPNVRVIHTPNQGPFLARQTAIDTATGDFLMFLDADDQLAPDALSKCKASLEHNDPDMIWFRHSRSTDYSLRPGIEWLPAGIYEEERLSQLRRSVVAGDHIALWGKVIRRSIAQTDTLRDRAWGLSMGEDWLQILTWFDRADTVVILEDALYFYRENPASIMNNYRRAHLDSLAVVFETLRAKAEEWGPEFADASANSMMLHSFSLIKTIQQTYRQRPDRLAEYSYLQRTLLTKFSLTPPNKAREWPGQIIIWLMQRGHLRTADCMMCARGWLLSVTEKASNISLWH